MKLCGKNLLLPFDRKDLYFQLKQIWVNLHLLDYSLKKILL